VQDAVSSKKVERFGKYETAEGYLEAFSRFVKKNADKVDALSILLKRPRDWPRRAKQTCSGLSKGPRKEVSRTLRVKLARDQRRKIKVDARDSRNVSSVNRHVGGCK
jgi:hypothetical protein